MYKALASDRRLTLKVFFASTDGLNSYHDPGFDHEVRWDDDMVGGFDHQFLPGAEHTRHASGSIRNGSLVTALAEFEPTIVQVYGLFHGISRTAITWAKRRRRRVFYIADSEVREPLTLLSAVRKRLTLPIAFSLIDRFLTIGDCNEAYYRKYGVPEAKFTRCPYPVDTRAFAGAVANTGALRRIVRARHSIGADSVVGICVSKLTTRKKVDDAIEAFVIAASRTTIESALIVVGDGERREALKVLSNSHANKTIRLTGYVPVADLPAYYCAADFLVHPSSHDPHPLAVSEAITCGLPVIVSDRVGSVGPTDDVQIGRNGIEYPFGNVSRLADAIAHLVGDRELRREMADWSLRIATKRSLDVSVKAFVGACMQ